MFFRLSAALGFPAMKTNWSDSRLLLQGLKKEQLNEGVADLGASFRGGR